MLPRGFTLVEVLIALAVLCVAGLGGVQLLVLSFEISATARLSTATAMLAAARLEQLRTLAFEYDANGSRLTDTTTDLTLDPPGSAGRGLTGSIGDSLDNNIPGFVDYLDAQGRWVGNGASPPPGAVFFRRWSVEPSAPAADLVVLQVRVRPIASAPVNSGSVRRARGESRFVTVLARVER